MGQCCHPPMDTGVREESTEAPSATQQHSSTHHTTPPQQTGDNGILSSMHHHTPPQAAGGGSGNGGDRESGSLQGGLIGGGGLVGGGGVGSGLSVNKNGIPPSLCCSVCFGLLATATSFTCGHTMCWACAHQWLSTDAQQRCPECRQATGELRRCIALDQLASDISKGWDERSEVYVEWSEKAHTGLQLAAEYSQRTKRQNNRRVARQWSESAEEDDSEDSTSMLDEEDYQLPFTDYHDFDGEDDADLQSEGEAESLMMGGLSASTSASSFASSSSSYQTPSPYPRLPPPVQISRTHYTPYSSYTPPPHASITDTFNSTPSRRNSPHRDSSSGGLLNTAFGWMASTHSHPSPSPSQQSRGRPSPQSHSGGGEFNGLSLLTSSISGLIDDLTSSTSTSSSSQPAAHSHLMTQSAADESNPQSPTSIHPLAHTPLSMSLGGGGDGQMQGHLDCSLAYLFSLNTPSHELPPVIPTHRGTGINRVCPVCGGGFRINEVICKGASGWMHYRCVNFATIIRHAAQEIRSRDSISAQQQHQKQVHVQLRCDLEDFRDAVRLREEITSPLIQVLPSMNRCSE